MEERRVTAQRDENVGKSGTVGNAHPVNHDWNTPYLEAPLPKASSSLALEFKHPWRAPPLALDNARPFLSIGGTMTQAGAPEGMCIPGKVHRWAKCMPCNQKRSLGHLTLTFFLLVIHCQSPTFLNLLLQRFQLLNWVLWCQPTCQCRRSIEPSLSLPINGIFLHIMCSSKSTFILVTG